MGRAVGRRRRRAVVTGGGAAGRWSCSRAGLQAGAITWWATGSGSQAPGAGDRGGERGAVLQPLGAPRWSAVPTSSWKDELGSGEVCCRPAASPSWGHRWGRCRAMAMSPGAMVRRDHHLVAAAWPRGGRPQATVLQPLKEHRWPAALASPWSDEHGSGEVCCRPAASPSWGHR